MKGCRSWKRAALARTRTADRSRVPTTRAAIATPLTAQRSPRLHYCVASSPTLASQNWILMGASPDCSVYAFKHKQLAKGSRTWSAKASATMKRSTHGPAKSPISPIRILFQSCDTSRLHPEKLDSTRQHVAMLSFSAHSFLNASGRGGGHPQLSATRHSRRTRGRNRSRYMARGPWQKAHGRRHTEAYEG